MREDGLACDSLHMLGQVIQADLAYITSHVTALGHLAQNLRVVDIAKLVKLGHGWSSHEVLQRMKDV